MAALITKKEVFQFKLRGDPIKIDMVEGENRWVWPETMEFFFEVDVLKKLPNGEVEVLYEIHAILPVDEKLNDIKTRTMILRVNQILHPPSEGSSTVYANSD